MLIETSLRRSCPRRGHSMADIKPDSLEKACSLVGRFQYHFGRLEQKIDQAVIKLLDLDERTAQIVTGSVDFAKKVNFVRTSAYEQATTAENKRLADDTCNSVFGINTTRQTVIHSSFEPTCDGSVQFRRTVAKDGRVRTDNPVWDDKEFSKHTTKMSTLEANLDKLIEIIKPVPFDLNNNWQDIYHRSSGARIPLALAQAHGLSPYDGSPLKPDNSDARRG
jgi:hypothetical protein